MKRLLLGVGALVLSVLAACSSEDELGKDSSDVVSGDRWVLPSEVLVVGANTRVTYDAAPKWTGTGACARTLLEGTRVVGEDIRDRFPQVSSIGGYACRKNTADTSRMSVHGTGRALDVFIPKKAGGADSIKGDAVANWLVMNASKIGVQLVIWNHTVWRANGRNAGAYGGPHPHDDHIHVEITNEASRMETPWFANRDDGPDASALDSGTTRADSGPTTNDAGSTTKDAGSKPPPPPPPEEEKKDAGSQETPPPPTPPKDTTPPSNDQDDEEENSPSGGWVPEGETGEKDSLGPSSKKKSSAASDDAGASSGCSASPVRTRDAAPFLLAVALGLILTSRRRAAASRS